MARLAQSAKRKALNIVVVGSSATVNVSMQRLYLEMILLPRHMFASPRVRFPFPPRSRFSRFSLFSGWGGGGRLRRRPAKPMRSPRVHSSTAKASIQ